MSTHRRFAERINSQGRVDRAAGTISGVKLLGRYSRNGREYTEAAMRGAVEKYRGTKVFIDHPGRERLGDDRSIDRCVGVIERPRFENYAIFGDVRLRKQSPYYEQVLELASEFSGSFGMSHVASGESRMVNGREVIEEIDEVHSVDIVCSPATAVGMYESVDDIDELGNPVVDLPDHKMTLKLSPDDIDGDFPESSGGGFEMPQSVRDLLKHRAILSMICGQDAIDELAAIVNSAYGKEIPGSKGPVKESTRLFDFTDSPFLFKEPGDFARRYR